MGARVRKALSLCNGIDESTAAPFLGQGLRLSFHCPVPT